MTYKEKIIECLTTKVGLTDYLASNVAEYLSKTIKPSAIELLDAPENAEWNEELFEKTNTRFIGRIEWLHTDGRVREFTEYENLEKLKKVAIEELNYGVPISVILYIDTSDALSDIADKAGALPCSFEKQLYEDRNTYHKAYLDDENVSFEQFYDLLYRNGLGDWNSVNDRGVIISYIIEKVKEDVRVSHILASLETNPNVKYFSIWLGNSAEEANPIETKNQLIEALGLTFEDLDVIYSEE